MPPDDTVDALEIEDYRVLAAAVLRSALDLPEATRAAYLRTEDFVFWCRVGNISPAQLTREARRLGSPSPRRADSD